MTPTVETLTPEDSLRDAIELLHRRRIRHLPVVESEILVGIVTDRDVKRATPTVLTGMPQEEYERALEDIKVARFMTREPTTVSRTSNLKNAVAMLIERRVGALPVVDGGRLVGILTDTDVLRVTKDLLPD